MIRPALILLLAGTAIFIAACESDQPRPQHHQFGYNDNGTEVGNPDMTGTSQTTTSTTPGTPGDTGGPIAPPPPPPPSTTTGPGVNPPNPTTNPGSASAASPAPRNDYPYAQPVPGKPGFVTSPFAPYEGYVDVRGFPPGTEVKDPYTGKIFLVP